MRSAQEKNVGKVRIIGPCPKSCLRLAQLRSHAMMHSGIVMGHRKNVSQNNGSDGSQRSSQSISVLPFLGLCANTRAFRPVSRLNGGVPTQPHSVSDFSLASLACRVNNCRSGGRGLSRRRDWACGNRRSGGATPGLSAQIHGAAPGSLLQKRPRTLLILRASSRQSAALYHWFNGTVTTRSKRSSATGQSPRAY